MAREVLRAMGKLTDEAHECLVWAHQLGRSPMHVQPIPFAVRSNRSVSRLGAFIPI
jgi:hypothetical protein